MTCSRLSRALMAALCLMPALAVPRAAADPAFSLSVLHRGDNGAFAVCDVDGDGKNDVLVARKPNALQWMSYPSLQPHVIAEGGNVWMEIQAGDVDGDGDCDVLAPDMTTSRITWWENPRDRAGSRTGGWTPHVIGAWDGVFAHDFKAGDIDHDGRLDAVLRTQAGKAFWVYLQDPGGAWTLRKLDQAFGRGEGTALGDIDGDGDLDITDGLVWLETPADPRRGIWTAHPCNTGFGSTLTRVAVADVDKDGHQDIVVSPSDTALPLKLAWYSAGNPRVGPWSEHVIMPAGGPAYIHTLQVGDVDGDGHPDILTGTDHRGTRELAIFYDDDHGKGLAWRKQSWPTQFGAWQAILADVNNDGHPDILSSDDANDAQQELWLNSGRSAIFPARFLGPPVKSRLRPGPTALFGNGNFRYDASGKRARIP